MLQPFFTIELAVVVHAWRTLGGRMNASELKRYAEEIVVSIAFAWTMIKPELLQTIHALALQSVPATAGTQPPAVDTPITDADTGVSLTPSEMQAYFVTALIPTVLVGFQSIAEETLNNHFGDSLPVAARLRVLSKNRVIDGSLSSEAHFWRLIRNVLMHGGGRVTQSTQKEAQRLLLNGEIDFTEFSLWGPYLDAGHGGVPVPITPASRTPPYAPGATAKRIAIVEGQQIKVGLSDVLAAGNVWAQVLARAT